jgi:hypothetical protein
METGTPNPNLPVRLCYDSPPNARIFALATLNLWPALTAYYIYTAVQYGAGTVVQ